MLPLDDRFIERADPSLAAQPHRRSHRRSRTSREPSACSESCSPNIKNKSHTITAHVEVPKGGGTACWSRPAASSGDTRLRQDGKPSYEYNWLTSVRYKIAGTEKLPVGPCASGWSSSTTAAGREEGGPCSLFVNDAQVATGRVDKTEPARFSADDTFDVGRDTGRR